MRRFIGTMALAIGLAMPALAQQVKVEEFTLPNGMTFLLVPRKDQPNIVAAGWLARVGSVNERPGITGISHFFEHMMFKGTNVIGTKDAAKDADLRAKQNSTRDRIRTLVLTTQYDRWKKGEINDPWDPKEWSPEIASLKAELDALEDQQKKETIVGNEFDRIYKNEGGSGMNAFTDYDVTFYFINVPSNKFELWAWMESDRLNDSVFREFFKERDVVHEERRMRTESTPTGQFQEQFDSMFWMSSPYNWPVIGWTSDLNSYTMEQAQEYFDVYYRPNNLVGVIVGDFDPDYVKPTIERYFGRLKKGEQAPPPVVTQEMPQKAEIRMYAECDCQPSVEVRYKAVPFLHKDGYALEIMSEILNGRTGRLYKTLVEKDGVASSAGAFLDGKKYAGAFSFSAETKGDATPEDLENAWYAILKDLQDNPVPDKELQKVKNRVAADAYRRLQSNFFLLVQLGVAEALGDYNEINDGPKKLQAVTPADIQAVAKKYFERTNRAVAVYTRKAGAAAPTDDAELAGLDPTAKAMVTQALAQLAKETDAAKLEGALGQMEAQATQVPPQFQPAFKIIIKRAQARLAELKGAK